MHILSLQPYFGGSHKAFQLGWQQHSRHQWTILQLPPRHWKWRMRHAAVHFAEQIELEFDDTFFDALFCSDFLNVAEFKGLVPEPIRRLPTVVYFHENQFAYPSRRYDERDLHFGFTNFTSCLAADQVWFNSAFNRDSFFEGLRAAAGKWPDYPPTKAIESIATKCRVEPPGINVGESLRDLHGASERPGDINLLWAARWEHDKNPALLLATLRELRRRNLDFRISVIGQSFRRIPQEFEQIKTEFADCINRWAYQRTLEEYYAAFAESDVFISTADHEFFGIAAAEAIVNGVIPVLPHRLAYPELLRANRDSRRAKLFLYNGSPTDLAEKLEYIASHQNTESVRQTQVELQKELSDELAWSVRAPQMDQQIEEICASACLRG